MNAQSPIVKISRARTLNRVLIISHDAVFAMDIEEMLGEHGIETVCFPHLDDVAISEVQGAGFISAVVDIDCHRNRSALFANQKVWPDVPVVLLGPGSTDVRYHSFAKDIRPASKPMRVEQLLPMLAPGFEPQRQAS